MKILWCVTGAGQFLRESVEALSKIKEQREVTVAFSRAGSEVARMYGLLEKIEKDFPEIIHERDQGSSSPLVGRLSLGEYERVIIAPCTANTAAKIVNGIADSLVTNVAAQAGKCKTPVYILPTDAEKIQRTRTPVNVIAERCMECVPCPAIEKCHGKAIASGDRIRIDLSRCDGCGACVKACKPGAIEFGREISIECREIDLENARRLKRIEGIFVLRDAREILSK